MAIRLLVDTCVWLDLAKDYREQPVISALEDLVENGEFELIVPQQVAESFVKTMKHNYVAFMDKSDAPTALSRLAITFEHYNERHPNKALKYRSSREFRRAAVSST